MIDKLRKDECCGCNACGDICPKGCISYEADHEGFLYPVIDHSMCIECNLCEKVCPVINVENIKNNDFEHPECYAAINKNLQVRFDSTSGGAFSAFAKKAYQDKAYVGGAIWNDDWTVSQYLSNSKKDLPKLRSSKYIQSDASGFYKQVKEKLQAGEKVLVCGTPCQMAALRCFLGKPYDNLIILDFVCAYVNSPKIWQAYIRYLEEKHHSKVIYIKDKNKEIGWRTLTNKVCFENGDVIYDSANKNAFRRCYMKLAVGSRPSCYNCKFKGFPRISDVTVADFWGVEKYLPQSYDNNLGTSLVLLNSKKGKQYFEDKVSSFMESTQIPFDSILGGNPALTKAHTAKTVVDRDKFYAELDSRNFGELVDSYIDKLGYEQNTLKKKIKNCLSFLIRVFKVSGWRPNVIWRNIKYNIFSSCVETCITKKQFMIVYPYAKLYLDKSSKIKVKGLFVVGANPIKGDVLHTKVILKKNALIDVQGDYSIGAGSDIQVFNNAIFTIKGGGDTNVNVEIVCGNNITFEEHVYLGRNVIVRDTNGNHYLSRQGYKTSRPVILGAHSWLCDRATVMPGVHVYPGGIVGASSYVTSDVPAFTMVSGNPAKIVDEEVYWKA